MGFFDKDFDKNLNNLLQIFIFALKHSFTAFILKSTLSLLSQAAGRE